MAQKPINQKACNDPHRTCLLLVVALLGAGSFSLRAGHDGKHLRTRGLVRWPAASRRHGCRRRRRCSRAVRTTVTSDIGRLPDSAAAAGHLRRRRSSSAAFRRSSGRSRSPGAYNAAVDVTMSPGGVSEAVTVVADAQPFVETAQVATNFKQDLMATLPSNRTIDAVLLMAPSVHATGPRGAFTIDGAQSYENLYTLNGAVINENLAGRDVSALHRGRPAGSHGRHAPACRPSTAASRAAWRTRSRSRAATRSAGRFARRLRTTTGAR